MWSSLRLAAGKIYAINQGTDIYVLDASPTYRLLATNSLGEHTNSSISASQGNLFFRTHAAASASNRDLLGPWPKERHWPWDRTGQEEQEMCATGRESSPQRVEQAKSTEASIR